MLASEEEHIARAPLFAVLCAWVMTVFLFAVLVAIPAPIRVVVFPRDKLVLNADEEGKSLVAMGHRIADGGARNWTEYAQRARFAGMMAVVLSLFFMGSCILWTPRAVKAGVSPPIATCVAGMSISLALGAAISMLFQVMVPWLGLIGGAAWLVTGPVWGLVLPSYVVVTMLNHAWTRLRPEAGLCGRCSYSLVGLPEPRCPECGTSFDPSIFPLEPQ